MSSPVPTVQTAGSTPVTPGVTAPGATGAHATVAAAEAASAGLTVTFTHPGGRIGVMMNEAAAHYLGGVTFELVGQTTDDSGVRWYLGDHQNSVRQVVGDGGQRVAKIDYDAFGNVTSQTLAGADTGAGVNVPMRFGFAGEQYDRGTGLIYHGQVRYTDPQSATHLQPDLAVEAGGDINARRVNRNNSVDNVDKDGWVVGGSGGWSNTGGVNLGGFVSRAIGGMSSPAIGGYVGSWFTPPASTPSFGSMTPAQQQHYYDNVQNVTSGQSAANAASFAAWDRSNSGWRGLLRANWDMNVAGLQGAGQGLRNVGGALQAAKDGFSEAVEEVALVPGFAVGLVSEETFAENSGLYAYAFGHYASGGSTATVAPAFVRDTGVGAARSFVGFGGDVLSGDAQRQSQAFANLGVGSLGMALNPSRGMTTPYQLKFDIMGTAGGVRVAYSPSYYPIPDPPMSAAAVRYVPTADAQVLRMRQGLAPIPRTRGGRWIEGHHRQQIPTSDGGIIDELWVDVHRQGGNHVRHNAPSRLTPAQRAMELRQHYMMRGNEYVLPGGEGI